MLTGSFIRCKHLKVCRRIILLIVSGYLLLLVGCAVFQRKLIFLPSHHNQSNGLTEWRHNNLIIGYVRKAEDSGTVWLFLHGNAGQAADRIYALSSFSPRDTVYILEYPGYGIRQGAPSQSAFNAAAKEAFELLRIQFPDRPVCIAAESIGTGPASYLATLSVAPEKIVLILPFDKFSNVAAGHYPFLPVKFLLRDNWDNIESLKNYKGELEIFAARHDSIIPIEHAKAVAASKPATRFHVIEGDHNDWTDVSKVKIWYTKQALK